MPQIEPLTSLAISMHACPSVYAILVGSGISRSAAIPTGWEVLLDLVRRVAAAQGEPDISQPEKWYRERFGCEPNYSDLLESLGKTPAERQAILRGYFETTSDETDQKHKRPTESHKAIANLVSRGYVRVLITTNFDRLLEHALQDVGITPTVVSKPSQIKGAKPFFHSDCFLLKVNGDYMDLWMRNTRQELRKYPPAMQKLLKQILDEHGLIVCGWSGEWDDGLRDALESMRSRRYSTYWCAYGGTLSDTASRLTNHLQATVIPIWGADEFFSQLWEKVQTVESCARDHRYTTAFAVELLKKYLVDQSHAIKLNDLVMNEVCRTFDRIKTLAEDKSVENLLEKFEKCAQICATLCALGAVGGRWYEPWHSKTWQEAFGFLLRKSQSCEKEKAIYFCCPRVFLFYSFACGAIASTRNDSGIIFLGDLLRRSNEEVMQSHSYEAGLTIEDLNTFMFQVLGDGCAANRSRVLQGAIMAITREYVCFGDEREAEKVVYILDVVLFANKYCRSWLKDNLVYGQLGWCRDLLVKEIEQDGDNSAWVKAGLFGDTARECCKNLMNLEFR